MNNNRLDFSIVRRQIFMCYTNLKKQGFDLAWELQDYIKLFSLYYAKYRQKFNKDHPRMTNEQISEVLCALPSFTDAFENEIGITPKEYPPLIDSYFEQKFNAGDYGQRCNYSLLRFTSGKIRFYRYAENQYSEENEEGID